MAFEAINRGPPCPSLKRRSCCKLLQDPLCPCKAFGTSETVFDYSPIRTGPLSGGASRWDKSLLWVERDCRKKEDR
jgi:hypothetical protein